MKENSYPTTCNQFIVLVHSISIHNVLFACNKETMLLKDQTKICPYVWTVHIT